MATDHLICGQDWDTIPRDYYNYFYNFLKVHAFKKTCWHSLPSSVCVTVSQQVYTVDIYVVELWPLSPPFHHIVKTVWLSTLETNGDLPRFTPEAISHHVKCFCEATGAVGFRQWPLAPNGRRMFIITATNNEPGPLNNMQARSSASAGERLGIRVSIMCCVCLVSGVI